MITKTTFIKGVMNKSVDERLLPQGEYIDGLNIRAGSTEDSEIGAIENSKGNELLTNIPDGITTLEYNGTPLDESNGAMCIGAYEDGANETIYFFVTSEIADIIASWTVGEDGVSGAIRYHVISTSVLNFSKENRIVGIDKIDDLLFFTDNLNPPRKINVTRSYGEPDLNDVDSITEEDLSVIVKPPLNAPTISTFNSERRGNYLEDKIITFSYRWRYQDGEYSALSPFSEAAFSPIGFRLDFDGLFNAGMKNRMNNAVVEVETGNDRVKEIQICFKRSGDNSVYVIDNYDKKGLDIDNDSTFNINFDNSKIYTVLPQEELFRLYDNVPRFAKAQTIMGNRVMYGNYVDGYDMYISEETKEEVQIDFDASLISSEVFTKPVDTETFNSSAYDIDPANTGYSVTDAGVRVDFTNFLSSNDLSQGSVVTFTFNIVHDSYTTSGTVPTDFQDSFNISSSIVLSQDYASANDLMGSPEFAAFIGTTNNIKPIADADEGGTLTDLFNANVSTSALPGGYSKAGSGLTATGQGFEYSLYTTNTPLILCNAMKYTHATDPDIYEYFSFNLVSVSVRSPQGFESLHSNRNYSLGIVYLDEQGRQSTVFTSQNNGVYTKPRTSTLKNQVRLQINSQPPYWATAYRPVIKPTYGTYETIYCSNNVFEDNTFAYFLLEAENARKVNEGDKLIVKSDANGPLINLVETTVLDVSTQESNFLLPNDAGSEGVIQPAGVYMKLKATNFTVNSNLTEDSEDLFFLGASQTVPGGYYTSGNAEGRALGATLITEEVGGTHVPVAIPAGTKVILTYKVGWNFNDGSGCSFEELDGAEFIAQNDYIDFREMVIAQNISLSDSGKYINPGASYPCYPVSQDNTLYTSTDTVLNAVGSDAPVGQNQFDFVKDSNSGAIALRLRSGANTFDVYPGNNNYASFAQVEITYQFSSVSETDAGAFVFETVPVDVDNEIYFESSETFLIQDGQHQGNQQNQLGAAPAVSNLNFFDCYAFGNGVESYKIEDLIAGDPLVIGQRTTSVSEQDYKEAHRFASITYSGVYNAETNLNKLNQFNLSLANFSDLEKSFGEIGILHARETDLLVLQEDRVSYVLQGKNLLSDSIGGGAVTSVPEVLGTQIARNEEYGISSDAETFAHFGNEVFFTDSKRGAVLSLIGGSYKQDQLVPISELGMRSYFRDTFIESFRSYKLGGFDPYMNEYVLTINEDEQDVVTPIIEEVECSPDNEFTTELISQDTYEVQFDPFIGTVEIDYTVQSVNETIMQVVWDDTQVVNSVISGTGSVSFTKTKNYPDTATVTISCPGLDVQPCNAGMDVLFLVDYSSLSGQTWMPDHIETLKNDMSGIISTIEQQSGGDYRLGLVTYESVDNSDIPTESGSVTTVGGADRLIDSTANFSGSLTGNPARGLNPFDGANVSSVVSSTELDFSVNGLFNFAGLPYAVGNEISGDWPKYTVQGDYHYLPSEQKYINTGSSYSQYVTCFEKFSSGNKDSFNRYLRSISIEANDLTTGLVTSVSANKLIDSSATFITNGVRPGDVIYKYISNPSVWSDGVSATVVSVDSETQLTLDTDIFTSSGSGQKYIYGTTVGTDAIRAFTPIQYKSQPSGIALSRIIEQNLAGAFRSNVNKQIILYTNTKPGGENAYHLEADADEFRRLASICNDLGIVLNIVGPDENPNVPDTWNVYDDAVSITNGVRVNSFASGSVLSAIESTCGAERTIPSYRCDQDITSLSLSSISTYTYRLDLGTTTGSAFVNSSSANPMSISVEYNGTTYTGGPGVSVQVEIPVTTQSLETTSIATVTLTSETNQTGVSITHTCPVLPPERKVYMVVVNDDNQSGETITNRYNVGTNDPTNDSTLDTVFSDSGVSNDTSVTGFTDGSNSIIPVNGDTVTVTSIKSPGQTGDFNPCNFIGYYVGPEQDLTPEVLLNKATFGDVTSTTAADGTETNEITFTVTSQDEGENPDNVYLIWNYRDNLPNVLQEIDVQGITQGGNIDIPLINSSTVINVTYPVTISITPLPSYGTVTKTNGDPITPGGFVATNESEAVVKYTQDGSANLTDTFGYTISSGGTCSASNVVNTESIAITENTYLYFNFDQSGSMKEENIILTELVTSGKLKQALLPFYNNDSNEYDKKVYVYPGTNYQIYSNYKFLDKSDPSAVTVQLVNRTVNQYPALGDRQFAGGFVGDPQEILTSVKIGGFLYSNIQAGPNTNAIIGKVTSIQYGEYGIFTVDTTVTEAQPEALERTGSSAPYDQLVYIENLEGDSPNNQYGWTREWKNERTWLVLQDHKPNRLLEDVRYIGRENEGSPYFNTYVLPESGFERADWTPLLGNEQGAVPSDKPDNVVMFVFQDEASETRDVDYYGDGTSSSEPPYEIADYPFFTLRGNNPTFYDSQANSPNHSGDIKNLRRRVELLNQNNPNFYKAAIFYMRLADGREPTGDDKIFREYLKAVQNGTGIYSGDNGLSDLSSVFNFDYDTSKAKILERRDSQSRIEKYFAEAPLVPSEYSSFDGQRFSGWDDYYLFKITKSLLDLGFSNPGGWPVVN